MLDDTSRAYLTRVAPGSARPADARRGLGDAVGHAARRTHAPAAFVELAMTALPRETDEQLTQRMLGYLGNTWWRFLSAAERQVRAPPASRLCCGMA